MHQKKDDIDPGPKRPGRLTLARATSDNNWLRQASCYWAPGEWPSGVGRQLCPITYGHELARLGSNQEFQDQNLVCYHYTTGYLRPWPRPGPLLGAVACRG